MLPSFLGDTDNNRLPPETCDLCALYLAWLLRAQHGEFDDGDADPPCPPELGKLTAPLEAFIDLTRIDCDLLTTAAVAGADLAPTMASSGRVDQLE